MQVVIAIDCMGGDFGPRVTVPAALNFLAGHADARVVLVGLQRDIESALKVDASLAARLTVKNATEVVRMDDAPAVALRAKKDSSIRVAVELVKSGDAGAFVSAGNTGALMAISRFVLKTLDGIDRPAIVSLLPNIKGTHTYMLDLGANVDCTPEHLLQFALMGATLAGAVDHKDNPTVGLLNIGEEAIKGNDVVKQAAGLLRASGLNFIGNVEGDDIYKGTCDVVVCDGFVGNVALKTAEGVAQMLRSALKEEFTRSPWRKLAALAAYPVLAAFKRRFDHRRFNGATLLGLRGIVIKSHGSADVLSFEHAIQRAYDEVKNDVLSRMTQRFTRAVAA